MTPRNNSTPLFENNVTKAVEDINSFPFEDFEFKVVTLNPVFMKTEITSICIVSAR